MRLSDLPAVTVDAPFDSVPGVVLYALAALAVALVLHRVGRRVLRELTRSYPILSAVLRYVDRPAQAVLAVLGLQAVWAESSPLLPWIVPLRAISALALIGALTWFGMRAAAAVADTIVRMHPLDAADNVRARRVHTQVRVLSRCAMGLILMIGLAVMLMTFPNVRQVGASLLASAGVAGLVAGIAARPVLGNLIAGLQIALSQPIRIDDVVVVQGEWGRVEDITGSYVAVRIWDQRRLIVPLQWMIENPFQNWTRTGSEILGSVFLWVDYEMPLAPLRDALTRLCEGAGEWDGRVCKLQVTDTNERAMQLRVLVSSADSSRNWDLRCLVREGMLDFIRAHYPEHLPRVRGEAGSRVFGEAAGVISA